MSGEEGNKAGSSPLPACTGTRSIGTGRTCEAYCSLVLPVSTRNPCHMYRFLDNVGATYDGGAVQLYNASARVSTTFTNCTFLRNAAGGAVGCVHISDNCPITEKVFASVTSCAPPPKLEGGGYGKGSLKTNQNSACSYSLIPSGACKVGADYANLSQQHGDMFPCRRPQRWCCVGRPPP